MARIRPGDRVPPTEYQTICRESKALDERSDCAVVAISVACSVPYRTAHTACEKRGRKPKDGMRTQDILKVVQDLGFQTIRADLDEFKNRLPEGHRRVLKNLTTYHARRFPGVFPADRMYLAFSNAHVTAISGGEAKDWAAGASKRITAIYEVVKVE